MKKFRVIIFLCIFVHIVFCFGCSCKTEKKETLSTTDYKTVVEEEYFKIQRNNRFETKYIIYDKHGSVIQEKNVGKHPLDIFFVHENILEIQIGYGTGTTVNQYYNILQNEFSPIFQNVIATSKEKIAFFRKDTADMTTLVVRSIFDNTYYKEFALSEEQVNVSEIHFAPKERGVVLSYFSKGEQKTVEFLL